MQINIEIDDDALLQIEVTPKGLQEYVASRLKTVEGVENEQLTVKRIPDPRHYLLDVTGASTDELKGKIQAALRTAPDLYR
ncbi:MAG: hypothetical protein LH606_18915 [Cytophagaceae bacterium]|nr:hypothetical protein [Cytophagaceae bacterium]